MRKRLLQLLSVRPGEGVVTLLMCLYILGAMTIYYILKPLRSGVFLTKLTSAELIYAYWLSALTAGAVATPIFKISRRYSTITVLTGINVLLIFTLLWFRWSLDQDIKFLPYVYYVYVQVVPVLTVAQFWLLAGYIYDNRQAKRIYPILGAGASAGALTGSYVEGFLRRHLSPDSLLLICVFVCVTLIILSHFSWRRRRTELDPRKEPQKRTVSRDRLVDLFPLVFGSRHLLMMVVFILLIMITSQVADWQIHDAAFTAYKNPDKVKQQEDIETFFGRFSFVTNILTLLTQIALAGWVLRRGGVGAAILVLPVSVFLASFGVLAFPVLAATVLVEGCDSVFRYSINRSGLEFLYLPLSGDVRKRIKLFIDVFIDRVGRALAGVIIFFMIAFQFGLRGTALAAMILTGCSVLISIRLRSTYVASFRQKLTLREIDLEPAERFVTDPASVRLLVDALQSTEERQILYSLRLLQSVRRGDFAERLLPLLRHPSPFVREQAVRTLPALKDSHESDAEGLLSDPSDGVCLAAVEYLCSRETDPGRPRLQKLLTHDKLEVRIAAAHWASGSAPDFRPSQDLVQEFLEVAGEHQAGARAAAAHLAARLPASEGITLLKKLMSDPSQEVAAAALRAAGEAGHLDLLFEIIRRLPRHRLRAPARSALLSYGPRIAGTLGDILSDSGRGLSVRREIPWLLARTPGPRSADFLIENLTTGDGLLQYRVVKGLNRIHEQDPELPLPRTPISESIRVEARAYYESLTYYHALVSEPAVDSSRLLVRALREYLDRKLEIIFRLLGLQYPQKDIYFAYAALRGKRPDRKLAAIEFLDNLLNQEIKTFILPLLEESSPERLVQRAARIFDLDEVGRDEAFRRILEHSDIWLKTCALHEIGHKRMKQFSEQCRRLMGDPEPLVRETAEWALKNCA